MSGEPSSEGKLVLLDDFVAFEDESPEWRRAFFQALSGTAGHDDLPPRTLVRNAESIADETERLRLLRARARKEADKRGERLNEILHNASGFRNKANGEVLKLFTSSDDGTKVYFSGGCVAVDDFDELFESVIKKET